MLSKILNILLILLVMGLVGNYFYRLPKFEDGEMAPSFQSERLDGTLFDLANTKGKYVLLDFWGSWCGPCRRENRLLVQLNNRFSRANFHDASGFEIVSIAIEKSEKSWLRAVEKDKLNWNNQIVQLHRFESPIAKLYGVKEIPTKYLIDPKGHIISVNQPINKISEFLDRKRKTKGLNH